MKVPTTLDEWYVLLSITRGVDYAESQLRSIDPFLTGDRFLVEIGGNQMSIAIRQWLLCPTTHSLHAEFVYSDAPRSFAQSLVNKSPLARVMPVEKIKYISTLIMSRAWD